MFTLSFAIWFKTSFCLESSNKLITWKFCAVAMCTNNVSLEIASSASVVDIPPGVDNLDVSGAGLLNSEQYYQRYVKLMDQHTISPGARAIVEAAILYRKNLKKSTEVVKAVFTAATDLETKNLAKEAGVWMAKVLHSSSNTLERMPVHAVVSSQPGRMFLVFTSCSSCLNSLQFLCLLTTQSWLAQLFINHNVLGKIHHSYSQHYWTNIVKTTTRSKEDYSEGREFRNEFNESFYANLTGDSYLVPLRSDKKALWDSHMLGRKDSSFNGYDLKDLLIMREEVLLRNKFNFALMRSENHSSLRKWLEWFRVQTDLSEFEAALSEVRPELGLRSIFNSWRQGSEEGVQAMEQIGLLNTDARKDYFELVRGSIDDVNFEQYKPTGVPPSLFSIKESLTTVYTAQALEKESALAEEPPAKKTKRGRKPRRTRRSTAAGSSLVVEEHGEEGGVQETGAEQLEGVGPEEGFEIVGDISSVSIAEKKAAMPEEKESEEASIKARQKELMGNLKSFLEAIEEAKLELSGESSGSDSKTRFSELDEEGQKEQLFVKISSPTFMRFNKDMSLKDQVVIAIKLINAEET